LPWFREGLQRTVKDLQVPACGNSRAAYAGFESTFRPLTRQRFEKRTIATSGVENPSASGVVAEQIFEPLIKRNKTQIPQLIVKVSLRHTRIGLKQKVLISPSVTRPKRSALWASIKFQFRQYTVEFFIEKWLTECICADTSEWKRLNQANSAVHQAPPSSAATMHSAQSKAA
jgi:hypothetical protein